MRTTSFYALLATAAIPALIAPAQADEHKEKSPTKVVSALAQRMTPEFADKIKFTIRKSAKQPVIFGKDGKIYITAANVRECARAYGYYLRNVAKVHFSWNGDNKSAAKLVIPKEDIKVPEALPFNYAFNYCTLSYTGAHWDKARWAREIDLMAMNGYQYVLVTSGLEAVWQGFLKDIGYPANKVEKIIANPAYSAWWHMGNLEGEGGPVHKDIIDYEADLGRFIVKRLRSLGMEPVMQGYVGFLPSDMRDKDINGKVIPQGNWCHVYPRPAVLQPTSPAFPKVAALWYKNLKKVYGYQGKYFGGDLFHEGGRQGGTPLKEAAEAVQQAMQKASPDSYWLLQAWGHNPSKVLLSGTDPEHTIIMALDKNLTANHNVARNYQGRPHVWCELANFGGNHGMYGGIELMENLVNGAGGAIGIGMISEGIETNPLYYAYVNERLNTTEKIEREPFLKNYAEARYGVADEDILKALNLLAESVYKPTRQQEGCQENILCARPSLTARKASTWSNPNDYYDKAMVEEAAKLMLKAGKKHNLAKLETFRYDMADLCRQVISDRARVQLPKCKQAYDAKDSKAFDKECDTYLQMIKDTAAILATSEHFLLGEYLRGAEAKGGKNPVARKQMSRAIKQLITTWTSKPGTTLNDYAHRQLSELMSHYYLKRWTAYFEARSAELSGKKLAGEGGRSAELSNENNGEKVSVSYELSKSVDEVEKSFPDADIPLLTKPKGNILSLAEKLLND